MTVVTVLQSCLKQGVAWLLWENAGTEKEVSLGREPGSWPELPPCSRGGPAARTLALPHGRLGVEGGQREEFQASAGAGSGCCKSAVSRTRSLVLAWGPLPYTDNRAQAVFLRVAFSRCLVVPVYVVVVTLTATAGREGGPVASILPAALVSAACSDRGGRALLPPTPRNCLALELLISALSQAAPLRGGELNVAPRPPDGPPK